MPGSCHVGPVDLLAGDAIDGVEPLERLAGDLPVLRVLELHRLRIRHIELGGRVRHLAVGRGAVRSLMRDDAFVDGQLRDRHLPLVGCGLLEHLARNRTALTHINVRRADAAAAAGAEVAPRAFAGEALTGSRIFPGDLVPVAFELFGDELAETGQRALAHLRARDADDDGVVGLDHHPGIDLGRGGLGVRVLRAAEREFEAKRKSATGGCGADDEGAAIHFRDIIHDCFPPHAFAAA